MNIQILDPTAQRIRYDDIVQRLREGLPPPGGVPPGQSGPAFQDAYDRRDREAFADVAELNPVDAMEAAMAVRCVVATAHAAHMLRESEKFPPAGRAAVAGRQVARQLLRAAKSTRLVLLATQKARRKREAADRMGRTPGHRGQERGLGGGLGFDAWAAAAWALLPPVAGGAEPAKPPRARPVLRLIRGGRGE